jgi:Protein of unknown function (DUF2577).
MTEHVPGDKLLNMINSRGGKDADFTDEVFGTVNTINPLSVWISQDLPNVTADFLELTTEAKGLTVDVVLQVSGGTTTGDKTDESEGQVAKGQIVVFAPLAPGDKVRMLRVKQGQRFIILGRA